MNDKITLTGMVLSASPVGEYDKRLVILTRERGKITAFAKGARRTNASLLAAANPFVFGTFTVLEGRTAYRLLQAEVQNYFRELVGDMEAACYGSYFLEVADYYTRENNDELPMLKLLYAAVRALLKPQLQRRLVRRVFELKAMTVNGEYPQVFSCLNCGSEEQLSVYLPEKEGILCADCARVHNGGITFLPSTVYTLQYVISSSEEKLFAFAVTEEVLKEFEYLVKRLCQRYMDRNFKSLEILEMLV